MKQAIEVRNQRKKSYKCCTTEFVLNLI